MNKACGKTAPSDLPPLITKQGVRFPGLAHSSSVKSFQSPIIGRSHAHQEKLSSQVKRRSDITHDLLRNKNIDDDEDSFLLNQDLEMLYKNATGKSTSSLNFCSNSKRSKLN